MNHSESETAKHERAIAAIAQSTAHPVEEVRSVFSKEYARLEASAKVRTHLSALTTSNVRAILRGHAAAKKRAA